MMHLHRRISPILISPTSIWGGILIIILLLGNSPSLTAETSRDQSEELLREMDFAYGRKIQLGSDSPLYQFYLDAHVYRHVADKRMMDLRVFNSQKETVPLRIREMKTKAYKRFTKEELPIFPLYAKREMLSGNLSLDVTANSKETHISLNRAQDRMDPEGVSGFLIDLGKEPKIPERLVVDLGPLRQKHRLVVSVSASMDLINWKVLVPSAALVKLTFNGQLLKRNHIDLPPFSERYLRLIWTSPFDGKVPSHITGLYSHKTFGPARKTTTVKGRRSGSRPLVYLFDSGGFFPVDGIQVSLPGPNRLIKARVFSSIHAAGPWHHRKDAIFYRLKIDAAELRNEPVELPVSQDRYYRLEIVAGSLPAQGPGPKLKLLWYPHECAFVASGDSPFMLAYGNAKLLREPQVVDDLLEAIGQTKKTTFLGFSRLDTPQVLGGDDRLKRPGYSSEIWLRVLLWGVLLASVAGLAWMAWRLHAQMQA